MDGSSTWEWDEAISNFASALEVDKGYGKAKDGLQWAKDNQKAAKQGKIVQDKPPLWN